MTKSSARRKSLRKMYKWNKERAKAAKAATPKAFTIAPFKDSPQPFRTPKVKKALSRIIEYEAHRPGEFAAWVTDLHIEHYRAGIQERLEKQREEERKNSQECATTENGTEAPSGSIYIT